MNAQRPGVSPGAGRLWRPAAAGPIRYWQEQLRLAVKGAVAAAAAWRTGWERPRRPGPADLRILQDAAEYAEHRSSGGQGVRK